MKKLSILCVVGLSMIGIAGCGNHQQKESSKDSAKISSLKAENSSLKAKNVIKQKRKSKSVEILLLLLIVKTKASKLNVISRAVINHLIMLLQEIRSMVVILIFQHHIMMRMLIVALTNRT